MNAVRPHLPRMAVLPMLLTLCVLVTGCNTVNQLLGKEESIDYKSASQPNKNAKLEVPPDLTQLPQDTRYQLPAGPASTTFSSYSTTKPAPSAPAATAVLPARSDMRVERAGAQRWLVVENRPPEQLYPIVRQFWQDNGFLIREDTPQAGVMETDWAENRAKIPQDFIRRTVGRVFDGLWSTGERDMYRTRLERSGSGTEIYISHRGAVEELTGSEKTQTIWTARPNDPGLEAEFLSRLMVRLGSDTDRAKSAVAQAAPVNDPGQAPRLLTVTPSGALQVNESFDRAWRRVGLALDRGGFTVEDRNRAEGTYFVRYVDTDAVNTTEKPGFFSRLFKRDTTETRPQFRVKLASAGEQTQVTVLNSQGAPENSATGRRILTVLGDQLK
ncbi:outer membrane protein assembly factor BamC [Pigmentiphaga litoralis]|uniref:outer membrane protein assembly factor BamC n=1 Tax=Pigmentiphaga litoralis TaxID=516702 RepID=UPI003570FBC1